MGIALAGPGETKDQETLANLNRFLSLVGAQNDSSMVLSLATFIEDTLGRLLLAYFRDCKATKELVEGFNAPLGTLGSRTKAAYAFGLLTKEQYQDIEILRKVRNQFAHNWEGVALTRGDIQSMIGQLSGYTLDQQPIEGGLREKLLGTISTCCIELQVFSLQWVRCWLTTRSTGRKSRYAVFAPVTSGVSQQVRRLRKLVDSIIYCSYS